VARFAAPLTTKFRLYALFIFGVCGQLLTRRHSSLPALTPDYAAVKFSFGAEGVEVL